MNINIRNSKHQIVNIRYVFNSIENFVYLVVKQICSDSLCPNDRVCISTPSYRPLCIIPGSMFL